MANICETLRGILSRIQRLESEIGVACLREVRRTSYEALCARYCALAQEAGKALERTFPLREPQRDDFGLSVGIARPAALQSLAGLTTDLKSAVEHAIEACLSAASALPCPKAAGRPCQMHGEIDPERFEIFFAIPFREPSTCKGACDALIDWLGKEQGIDEKSIFRADRWTYSGDFVCKICKAIQESRVVVADITGTNPNVFFELGMAVGLGKSAILIYDEKASEGRVPSDLLAWEYVPYDGSNPLDKDWLEHFAVVFAGMRQRREQL